MIGDLNVGDAQDDLAVGARPPLPGLLGGFGGLVGQAEGLIDLGLQLLLVEGLGHKGAHAGAHGLLLLFFVSLAGGHQKRERAESGMPAHPLQQLQTVLVGHVPVADNQIDRGFLLQQADGGIAVRGLADRFEPERPQGLGFDFAHDGRIFNQQYANRLWINTQNASFRKHPWIAVEFHFGLA